jgi:hypothetical protein
MASTVLHSVDLPDPLVAGHLVAEARRLFGRTLAGWASDQLGLRHRGLHAATWRAEPAGADWCAVDEDGPGTWSLAA